MKPPKPKGDTLSTQAIPAPATPELQDGCSAITARRGILKPCGFKVVKDGLCREHLEIRATSTVPAERITAMKTYTSGQISKGFALLSQWYEGWPVDTISIDQIMEAIDCAGN